MLTRTTIKTVTFARPFLLAGLGGACPAGSYVIETGEELIEPLSFVAYRRISTSIQLPERSGRAGCVETHVIDPDALAAALARDAADGRGCPRGTGEAVATGPDADARRRRLGPDPRSCLAPARRP